MNKILILGHESHGKDEVAKIIAGSTNLRFESASLIGLDVIYDRLQSEVDVPYNSKEDAYLDRDNHRVLWRELFREYNTPNPTAIVELVLEESDLYAGVRCSDTLESAVDKELFDYILWVDANKRLGIADESIEFSFDDEFMIYIDNNGNMSKLETAISEFLIENDIT